MGCDSTGLLHQPVGRGLPPLIRSVMEGVSGPCVWLLTHPHYDHVQGIELLSVELHDRVERICVPQEYTERDAWPEVRRAIISGWGDAELGPELAADELQRTLDFWADLPNAEQLVTSAVADVVVYEKEVDLQGGGKQLIRVSVLSPSWARLRRLRGAAQVAAAKSAAQSRSLSRDNANSGSAVFAIVVGQLGVLLAGDADAADVAKSMIRLQTEGVSTLIYKVSHHGSDTGFSCDVSVALSGFESVHALICPFSSRGLPVAGVVNSLSEVCDSMHVCGSSAGSGRGGGCVPAVADWTLGWTAQCDLEASGDVRVHVSRPSLRGDP